MEVTLLIFRINRPAVSLKLKISDLHLMLFFNEQFYYNIRSDLTVLLQRFLRQKVIIQAQFLYLKTGFVMIVIL